MSDPADITGSTRERDPVLEVREHLEHALAALDKLREILPGARQPGRGDPS